MNSYKDQKPDGVCIYFLYRTVLPKFIFFIYLRLTVIVCLKEMILIRLRLDFIVMETSV